MNRNQQELKKLARKDNKLLTSLRNIIGLYNSYDYPSRHDLTQLIMLSEIRTAV